MAYETDARKQDRQGDMNLQPKGETWKKWSQLVAQVWVDENLKQRLKDNPAAVLQEHGLPVPAGTDIRVVENTHKVTYLILPPKPAGDVTELASSQLSSVAGGFTMVGTFACNQPDHPDHSEISIVKLLDASTPKLY